MKNAAGRYTMIGVAFGFMFPIIATIINSYQQFGELTVNHMLSIQSTNALIWIIDSAPLFLGLFALKAGLIQQKVNDLNAGLQEEVRAQTDNLEKANQQLREEIDVRIKNEEELIIAKDEAIQGAVIKDQFLSNMSHEIRTPLNGIIGMTNILLETEMSEEQSKYLSAVSYSSKNLLVIINDILDLSKINAERIDLESTNFNIRQVLESVDKTLRLKVDEKAIGLNLEISDDIPEVLQGDPARLNQILLNLVGNAVKFTEKGSVDIKCSLVKQTEEAYRIHFDITDTGIGIKKDNIQKIFESFSQANSGINRKFGGTGLGLPISKKLIELFGGELTVESEYGKGSRFHFAVDFGMPIDEEVSTDNDLDIQISDEEKAQIKILLAEDNKINQIVAKRFLDKFGFQSEIANHGKEAIQKVQENDFDLILMDIQMPELDGLEATRFIRNSLKEEKKKNIKIMAMTASVLKKEIDRCYEAGMDEYIAKPFDPDELYNKILSLTCLSN